MIVECAPGYTRVPEVFESVVAQTRKAAVQRCWLCLQLHLVGATNHRICGRATLLWSYE